MFGRLLGSAAVGWFASRPLDDGVWLIAEPCHVNSYLVEGSDARAHIDTGLGVANIRAVGDALGRAPLAMAANTHHHFDHVAGNPSFDEIAIHEAGADLLARGTEPWQLESYRSWVRGMYAAWPDYARLDEDYFGLVDDVARLRPVPDGFTWEGWNVPASTATRTFADGDVLELGGGTALRVLHTPGHTPDSVCFLDERRGLLFGGDTVNSASILVNDPTSSFEDFVRSTRRLADELAGSVLGVFMAHGSRYRAEGAYLRELADGAEATANGDVPIDEIDDQFGEGPARVARFDRFSIVLPA
jgi:glyoxylase-like metal-dependent hydrolase (beta-lactamase superfamily II)